MKTILPTRVCDWSMRRLGYLTKHHLGLAAFAASPASASITRPPTAPTAHASN